MKKKIGILIILLVLLCIGYFLFIRSYKVKNEDMAGKYVLEGGYGYTVKSVDTLVLGIDGFYQITDSVNNIKYQGRWFETGEGFYCLENYMDVKPYRKLFGTEHIPISTDLFIIVSLPDLYYRKVSDKKMN